MSRVEVISSDEEESIWQHKSQIKRRKLSQSVRSKTSTSINDTVKKKKKDHTRNSLNTVTSQGFKSLPTTKLSCTVKNEEQSTSLDFKPTKIYSQIIQDVSVLKRRQSTTTQVKEDPDVIEIPDKQKRKSKSRSTRRKSSIKKDVHATPDDKKWSGRCRNCQFPFSALSKIDTPSWHMKDCLDAPYSSTDQCPSGINCSSTIASHYKKFRHTALSRSEHKKENARPPSSAGDIESAKVKLKFNDKQPVPPRPSVAVSDVVSLDSDSSANSDTGLSLSQNEMAITRERIDKLKRKSVLTLMKQTAHKLTRPVSSQNIVDDYGTERLSDKNASESNIGDDRYICDKFKVKLQKETNELEHIPNCDKVQDVKVYIGKELGSEEIITKVDPIDLIGSESSNSVQDVNCITDNSRSIQEMLKDVFDNSSQDRESSGERRDSDIVENSLQGSESDSDSDIIQSGLPSLSKLRHKISYNKDDNCNDGKVNDLNKDSLYTCRDVNMKSIINGPADVVKSCGGTGILADINSNNALPAHDDESNSCSRDSAKGFFARKLEEKKMKNHQRITLEVESSKHKNEKNCGKKELNESEASIQGNNRVQKEYGKLSSDADCLTSDHKPTLKGNKGEMNIKHNTGKLSTSIQRKPLTIGKTSKSRKPIKKHTQTKSTIKKEIKLMEMDGLGKITVETASSEEDNSESFDKTEYMKTNVVDHSDQKMSGETYEGNDMPRNSCDKINSNSETKLVGYNHASECLGIDSRASVADGILPFFQESTKGLNLTPKFQISDVRSTRDNATLPGGFFIDNNDETEDKDDCSTKVNLSEGEEGDDICNVNDLVNDLNVNILVNDNNINDNNDNFTKVRNNDIKNMQQIITLDDQTVPNINDFNLPCVDSGSDSEDTAKVLDNIASKVQEIQRNAVEIIMQTSKALHNKDKSKNPNKKDISTSHSKSSRNVNEFLMSNRGKDLQTATKPEVKAKPNNQTSPVIPKNEPETSNNNQRKCPFYKKIPGTSFTVDAFRYGSIPDCKAYILSHFHYDHYGGLTKKFTHPIYCSKITGNLVIKKIGVQAQYIHTVPLNKPTIIEDVEIVMLEANHCPGAVLILFKLRSGQIFLHTGDFRACRDMESYPPLQNLRIHSLYLDTTYCDPQYDFPPQKDVVNYAVKLAKEAVSSNPSTLIVCGSYTIGKERIFRGIAEELGCKISVTRDKKSVLDCLEDDWLQSRVTLKWEESRLHVLPMAKLNYVGLKEHLQKNGSKYSAVLGIKPTGWTYNKKLIGLDHIKPEVNKDSIKVYGLPYSEHSSYLELKQFVQFTKPDKILPTVNNGNYHSRKKMEAIFAAWMEEIRHKPASASVQPSVSYWAK